MSDTVKKMLTEDIGLKEELNRKFIMIVCSIVGLIIIMLVLFFFGLCYYKKTVRVWQKEKTFIQLQRDSLRFEKELFYRLQDTTEYFVWPIRDTIKINNGNTK